MSAATQRIAVVGAGISGLATALALKKKGFDVVVFEASERPGGPIKSDQVDGYLLERGPHTLLARSADVHDLLDDLGLQEQALDANAVAKRRYIVQNGAPVALPSSPKDAVSTPILSSRAKLRVLLEPLIGRFDEPEVDETLAHFITRRLGQEVLDFLVDPFVAGIWAGNPNQLSARHTFPKLVEWEEASGSILVGAIKSMLPGGEPRSPRRLMSFEKGLGTLVDAFCNELGESVQLSTPVRKIRRDEHDWRVIFERGKSRTGQSFDAVVLTVPTYRLPDIEWQNTAPPPGIATRLSTLPYAPVALVHLGYNTADVAHPLDGLGLLIPASEEFHILGILFVSSMFPDRAPDGHALLSVFVGGARQPEIARRSDADILDVARHDVGRILGIDAAPSFEALTRYEQAIPQYEVGFEHYLRYMEAFEAQLPGVFLAGNFRDSIGVPALLEASHKHAARIETFLSE